MLLKIKKSFERGNIEPKMILAPLGVILVLMATYSYMQNKKMQEIEQQVQQSKASIIASTITNPSTGSSTTSSITTNNTVPETAQSAFRDLSQIRAQVQQLTELHRRFEQAKPTQVLNDTSNTSEQIASMMSIQSELSRVNVDGCLIEPKSNIQRSMQLDIDAFTAYLQYGEAGREAFFSKLAEASALINGIYGQLNVCQNN
jgi:hypothetical protein